ncbi:MAG: type II toxin-antitoxin system HicB family antitoxin [Synergistaceae bacterium]|nr:type II toxin-antitoxin system HicB family antitoxin [Synergistaceae bacterium]
MISVYPGIFVQDTQGRYTVIFPDLNHLATCGDDMQEAMVMAVDCLAGYIHSEHRDGHTVPQASSLEQIDFGAEHIDENDPDIARVFVNLVSVDVEEYARNHFNKAVKKTLSIPQWLNDMAIAQKINFSKVLQAALKRELGVEV